MSKKRFSSGLDDLFNDSYSYEELAIAENKDTKAEQVLYRPMERKAHAKNFVSDLDSLLQEAMDESVEKMEARQQTNVYSSGKSKSAAGIASSRGPLSGLDALIRQTIDVKEMTTDEITGKKRLTVAVDKPQLDKLKTIARMENSFLKDILVQLIDEYIQEYSNHKGVDL